MRQRAWLRVVLAGCVLLGSACARAQVQAQEVWHFDRTDSLGGHVTKVLGDPQVIETEYGKAIHFNGKDDALFVNVHPLAGAKTWTWEMIFRPDADGAEAQRIFDLQVQDPATGKDIADRMLFEIRIVKGEWCLDSFATSAGQHATLLNCEDLHPFGPFYRVTAVYDGTTLRNYVGDAMQGEAKVELAPQGAGHSSVGVRINLRDYFKGTILEARFTKSALAVGNCLKMPATR